MNNPFRHGPPALLAFGLFAALLFLVSQGGFHSEAPLSFSPEENVLQVVELGPGFPEPGAHQFSDAMPLLSVIDLTDALLTEKSAVDSDCPAVLTSGLSVDVCINLQKVTQIQCGWMPASHRMALGIPLHPDKMSREDWTRLPGIGSRMAERIESDRQINGDFMDFRALQRVKGVGEKRISSWEKFF